MLYLSPNRDENYMVVAGNSLALILGIQEEQVVPARYYISLAIEIGSTKGKALAIRWLLGAFQKRSGRNMAFKLSSELVDAAKGNGDAIRKKEETHRMAEANRAFAHFR
ncbi:hypothetical protein V6N12_065390 [Hibiscus sabdariffa]|uniref:Small ribosomal subunit protein uS7 domain-containing protein n=1 Tax=Hibiscus sabdariffa TaxID=183260 RepID=A0ABR2G8J7_9ROSI